MNRRSSRSLAGSPLLIGAVTTLVVIVAVFLSYNANNGLPFVPTYDINVRCPTRQPADRQRRAHRRHARRAVTGSAEQDPHTGASTRSSLKLEKRLQELPLDTTAIVRDRSSLGEKYLELNPGTRRASSPRAGRSRSRQTREPVEIDQVLNMFNAPTRVGQQTTLTAYGNAFAGRGANSTTRSRRCRPLANLEPLARTLAAPHTHLGGLFAALERATPRSRRWRRRTRRCSAISTRRSRRSPPSPRRSARPPTTGRRADPGHVLAGVRGRSSPTPTLLLAAAPGARAAHRRPDAWPRRRGRRQQPAGGGGRQPPHSHDAGRAAAFAKDPRVPPGCRPDGRARARQPDRRRSAGMQTDATTRRCCSATSPARWPRARRRHLGCAAGR